MARVPALAKAGVKELINGPESFTPDGNFIIGPAPGLEGYYVGAGFNAFGIASGGGAGKVLAEWIVGGAAPFDVWPVDIRRFGAPHTDIDWVRARTLELYGKHYSIAWPGEEHESGRPLRRSPLYEQLRAQGAVFGEKLGWERPNWFAAAGERARDEYSFTRPNWFAAVAREHQAARERVALFDQSSFAKFLLLGRDAGRALDWICANDMARPVGSLAYTQLLNERGGIECDLTVARLAADRYYLVTGTGFATHDFDWITRALPQGCDAQLSDVTSARAVLALMGPQSRRVLERLTRSDLGNDAFPFGQARVTAACRRAGHGAARHLRGRTRLGAARAGGIRRDPVRRAHAGRRGIRHRQCRLPRDRIAAPGKRLSRLGRGHRAGSHAARGGPRLGRETRQPPRRSWVATRCLRSGASR